MYVDDPAFTLAGPPARRRRCNALIVLAWRIIDLELAFKKGQSGRTVDWICCQLRLTSVGVTAQLQAESVLELQLQRFVADVLTSNTSCPRRCCALSPASCPTPPGL